MKSLLAIFIAVITAFCATAEQEVFDYELTVGNFNKLKVVNDLNVVYQQSTDSAGIARFSAPKSMSDYFIATNKDGQLKLETMPYEAPEKTIPTLYVYSEFLEEVINDGNGTVTINELAPCSQFKAVIVGNGHISVDGIHSTNVNAFINTGNGTIALNGECTNARFKMVGTGLIQADNLRSDYVTCRILGSGAIGCWPRFELKTQGIGSTKIYYKGTPEIHKRGGGKLFPIDTDNDDHNRNDNEDNSDIDISIKQRQ